MSVTIVAVRFYDETSYGYNFTMRLGDKEFRWSWTRGINKRRKPPQVHIPKYPERSTRSRLLVELLERIGMTVEVKIVKNVRARKIYENCGGIPHKEFQRSALLALGFENVESIVE